MIFTDLSFFLFFIIVCLLYFTSPGRYSILILTVASYVFYAGWDYKFLPLLLWVTIIDYACGGLIGKSKSESVRKLGISISVISNLSTLFFFKYTNFFIDVLNYSFGLKLDHLNIVLPPGISFFVFQSLSYTIDVYRRKLDYESSFLNLSCFVSFFPHLVAGPIVRGTKLIPQLRALTKPKLNYVNIVLGYNQFLSGLLKKVVIADPLSALIVKPIFADPQAYSSGSLALGVIAFGVQIYCDFSGYTDMAIGISKILNFDLPINFNFPYLARNITEFWRRWHMTLSFWLRDYLYISLGGSRKHLYRNLVLTMFLGGLWHGASLNFAIWGLYHGFILALERLLGWRDSREEYTAAKINFFSSLVRTFYTNIIVFYGWMLFRAQSFSDIALFNHGLFSLKDGQGIELTLPVKVAFVAFVFNHFWVGGLIQYKPSLWHKLTNFWDRHIVLQGIVLFMVFSYILLFVHTDKNPFIYFQF